MLVPSSLKHVVPDQSGVSAVTAKDLGIVIPFLPIFSSRMGGNRYAWFAKPHTPYYLLLRRSL